MKTYAYYGDPDIIKKSSSGGAFTAVVDAFCEQHEAFSIYGAIWTKDLKVSHYRVTTKEDASLFRGSKYVRSNIKGIYIAVKKDLQDGKAVLFSGTPCQVAGLKTYLDEESLPTDKLMTVDIICHGAPNPIVFDDFKKWIEQKHKSQVKSITFRDKSVGWKQYPTGIRFDNGKELRWSYDAQLYIRMYFSLLILDKKCYSCKYSNMDRVSDITLGDFWGVEKILPDISQSKGVSLMIVNSFQGEKILERIQHNINPKGFLKEYAGKEYLQYQHNLNQPTQLPCNYQEFWNDYRQYGFENVIKKYGLYTLKGKTKFFLRSMTLHFKWFRKRFF